MTRVRGASLPAHQCASGCQQFRQLLCSMKAFEDEFGYENIVEIWTKLGLAEMLRTVQGAMAHNESRPVRANCFEHLSCSVATF